MPAKLKVIPVRISDETHAALMEMKRREFGKSASVMIREAIHEYLTKRNKGKK